MPSFCLLHELSVPPFSFLLPFSFFVFFLSSHLYSPRFTTPLHWCACKRHARQLFLFDWMLISSSLLVLLQQFLHFYLKAVGGKLDRLTLIEIKFLFSMWYWGCLIYSDILSISICRRVKSSIVSSPSKHKRRKPPFVYMDIFHLLVLASGNVSTTCGSPSSSLFTP